MNSSHYMEGILSLSPLHPIGCQKHETSELVPLLFAVFRLHSSLLSALLWKILGNYELQMAMFP